MIFGRLTFAFLLVTVAAFFCAQNVEAAKGPRVTHKVYFDIKHGDENLGRSTYIALCAIRSWLTIPANVVTMGLFGGVRSPEDCVV